MFQRLFCLCKIISLGRSDCLNVTWYRDDYEKNQKFLLNLWTHKRWKNKYSEKTKEGPPTLYNI